MKSPLLCLALMGLVANALTPATRAQAAAGAVEMTTTESGLKYVITSRGSGPAAKVGQVVIVHYVGTFLDGKLLDSSRQRGQPFAFTLGLGRVIRGWDEGFALLRVGDKATFLIPPDLAYGGQPRGPIPANSTLRFDVELLDLKEYALADVLLETLDVRGPEATQRLFEELKAEKFDGLHVDEGQINGLGYARLGKQKLAEAIAVFRWNVELFPGSANVYDSLGEAYAKDGRQELAIQNYERSLAINPKNANAEKKLAGLKSVPAGAP
jgi:peptidylprolyl isomerase